MLSHEELQAAIPQALERVDLPTSAPRQAGKVRDSYQFWSSRLLITTDRVSAFDQVLGVVPFKGQVLNQLSAWWFAQTRDIVPNHLLAVPDPNVMLVRDLAPLPVEVVVRGSITGVTSTSLWTLYEQGERAPYGVELPEGLQKNDPLPTPMLTPTSKASGGAHDERLTREEIIERGVVAAGVWEQIEQVALALFARGQERARAAGLVLVDTKYEFALHEGKLLLIDELHTPDSSRFWRAETPETPETPETSDDNAEPAHLDKEHLDKEYLRLWLAQQGYQGAGPPPTLPADLLAEVAARFIAVYEQLTGQAFVPAAQPASQRIVDALRGLLP